MSTMSEKSKRAIFEHEVKRIYNLETTRAEDGGYKNNVIEYMWTMFQNGYSEGSKKGQKFRRRKDTENDAYVISRITDAGELVFSHKPHIHFGINNAEREKKRLVRLVPDERFLIFHLVN